MEFWDGSDMNPAPQPRRRQSPILPVFVAAAVLLVVLVVGLTWSAPMLHQANVFTMTGAYRDGDTQGYLYAVETNGALAAEHCGVMLVTPDGMILQVDEADIVFDQDGWKVFSGEVENAYDVPMLPWAMLNGQLVIQPMDGRFLPVPAVLATPTPTPTPRPTYTPTPRPTFTPTPIPTATPKRLPTEPTSSLFHRFPLNTRYFYHQLTTHEKQLFSILYDGYCNFETEIVLDTADQFTYEEYLRVLDVLLEDCPELIQYSIMGEQQGKSNRLGDYMYTIWPAYGLSRQETEQRLNRMFADTEAIRYRSDFGASDLEKEMAIYNYVCDVTTYQRDVGRSAYADAVMVDGYGQCVAYARAFMFACRYYDIPCLMVGGDILDEYGRVEDTHSWNIVKIGGDWYQADATWEDTSRDDKSPQIYVDTLRYFNLTDRQMYHRRNLFDKFRGEFTVPVCTATRYNYFECFAPEALVSGSWKDFLRNRLEECYRAGGDAVALKFNNEADYLDAKEHAVDVYRSWEKKHGLNKRIWLYSHDGTWTYFLYDLNF